MDIERLKNQLADEPALRPIGHVVAVTGLTVRLTLPGARVGEVVVLRRKSQPLLAEIVGFERGEAVAVPLGDLTLVGPDDPVESTNRTLEVGVGKGLLGRVVDGLGRALDGRPLPEQLTLVPVNRTPPPALGRRPIDRILTTGVRVLDGFCTLGVGQRVGLFSGSGVGKSTLLGQIARGADADVVVVALVGERGREVNEFLAQNLGHGALERAVVVVSTSDAPSLERLRGVQTATAIAEFFRDDGKNVLLLVDSMTRVARAQREVGLSAGEPPTRRGYPPSVFAMLPRLLERAGQGASGSITALYTVLVEGDDLDEPVADEMRGILDGHIVLDRGLSGLGHYPAVDITRSLSRVMDRIVDPEHRAAATQLRALVAAYEAKRDLIVLGAYSAGSDPQVDRAIQLKPALDRLLLQDAAASIAFEETRAELLRVAAA